jgi:SAM-dependent methyltransferase
MEPDRQEHDQQAVIKARIRRGLRYRFGSTDGSKHFGGTDPHPPERRRAALQMIDERTDLVGFDLSTRLKGLGRVSTAAREGLRRALFEVLFRQTEFNRAGSELIHGHEVQLAALGATVRAQLDIQADADQRLEALEQRLDQVEASSHDYVSFSERFRVATEGHRDDLSRFVPRFEGRSEVIDAGCGRGEFLEFLREAGIAAVGVDTDEALVAQCRGRGLDAIHGDVLDYLRGRPEGSHGGMFAAHLIEHLDRDEIVEFVRLAFSKLRPEGVLVVETVVGPVPPVALRWLTESCGFASVAIERTPSVTADRGVAATDELPFGFQEYALTARKPAG